MSIEEDEALLKKIRARRLSQGLPITVSDGTFNNTIRRIADCLEQHLEEYGFEPYCYPSGENKSVQLVGDTIFVSRADGEGWTLKMSLLPYRRTT